MPSSRNTIKEIILKIRFVLHEKQYHKVPVNTCMRMAKHWPISALHSLVQLLPHHIRDFF